jgi:two-component SAPR family response regulator
MNSPAHLKVHSFLIFCKDEIRCKAIYNKIIENEPNSQITVVSDLVNLCSYHTLLSKDSIFLDLVQSEIPIQCYQFVFSEFKNVIIISDQTEHAVWAFEFGAIDFIPFPYDLSRLNNTLSKIKSVQNNHINISEDDSIFIKQSREIIRIKFREITYIQAFGNYIRIYLESNKSITSLEKISFFYHRLRAGQFTRVHKSYIINNAFLKSFDKKEVILSNGVKLPLSLTYKHLLNVQHIY